MPPTHGTPPRAGAARDLAARNPNSRYSRRRLLEAGMTNVEEATLYLDLFRSRGAEIADACTRCGDCFRACPMTEPGGIAGADPSEAAAGLHALVPGGAGDGQGLRRGEMC